MFLRSTQKTEDGKKAGPDRLGGDRRLVKLLTQPLILEEAGPPRLLTQMAQAIRPTINS